MKRLPQIAAALAAPLVLAALLAAPAGAATGVSPAREFAPRQLIVKFDGAARAKTLRLPRGADVRASAVALRRDPRVAYAVPNYAATASATVTPVPFAVPDDPGTLEGIEGSVSGGWALKQWDFLSPEPEALGLPTSPGGMDAVGAWRHVAEAGRPGGAGETIAVLDSGVAYRNFSPGYRISPDFSPDQFVEGYDFVDHDRLPLDRNGHGTHVAGTIAEKTGNGVGLTGLAYGARLMPLRTLNRKGVGYANVIAKAIRYAVERRVDVINMSFNFDCGQKVPSVDEALREAYAKGVIVVASGGNLPSATAVGKGAKACVAEPATGPHVIAVAGSTEGGCVGSYSLAGTAIDLLAPGGGTPAAGCPSILSRSIYQVTLKPKTTDEFAIPTFYTGTSMAAAHVSGAAALVLASGVLGKKLGPKGLVVAMTKRLRGTARSLGLPATRQGAGLIDVGAATDPAVFVPLSGRR